MSKNTLLIMMVTLFYSVTSLSYAQTGAAESSVPELDVEEVKAEMSEEEQYWAWARGVWETLTPQSGEIKIEAAGAVLDVPETFYFLDAKDSETVLVDVWGNPPGQNVLGMIFPEQMTPFDDGSWGVSIEYEEDGYVSDEDAADIDFADLLTQMQEDTRASSESRVNQGYEAIELVGWAATPFYDADTHKMHWAKELKFGQQDAHTLNYNIRVLGRKGVLVLNFIADMSQKDEIDNNLEAVLALAEFDDGARYADFDPDIDQVAAYGLGALVAGKVIAKTGFIAMAILFLKKFGIFILLAIVGLFKTVFGRKKQ